MGKDWLGAQTGKPEPDIKEEIINVALEYHLMTQYTSFVAVEKMIVTEGGKPRTIAVPVEMPEGVSYEGIFGEKTGRCHGGLGGNRSCRQLLCGPCRQGRRLWRPRRCTRAPVMKAAARDATVAGSTPLYKLGRGNAATPANIPAQELNSLSAGDRIEADGDIAAMDAKTHRGPEARPDAARASGEVSQVR